MVTLARKEKKMALCMDGGEGSKASWFGIYEMSERERELTRDGI